MANIKNMRNIKNMNVGSIRNGIQCIDYEVDLSSTKTKRRGSSLFATLLVSGMLANPQILKQLEKV